MWLPFFSAAVVPPDPPDVADRCPFFVVDPLGLCEYCGHPEGVHDERALEGKL